MRAASRVTVVLENLMRQCICISIEIQHLIKLTRIESVWIVPVQRVEVCGVRQAH